MVDIAQISSQIRQGAVNTAQITRDFGREISRTKSQEEKANLRRERDIVLGSFKLDQSVAAPLQRTQVSETLGRIGRGGLVAAQKVLAPIERFARIDPTERSQRLINLPESQVGTLTFIERKDREILLAQPGRRADSGILRGIETGAEFGAEKILRTSERIVRKVGEVTPEGIKERIKTEAPILFTDLNRKETRKFISDLIKFGVFLQPLGQFGAAAKTKGKKAVVVGKKKPEVKKRPPTRKELLESQNVFLESLGQKTNQELRDMVRRIIQETKNKDLLTRRLSAIKEAIGSVKNPRAANILVDDVIKQEVVPVGIIRKRKPKVDVTEPEVIGAGVESRTAIGRAAERFDITVEPTTIPGELSQVGIVTGITPISGLTPTPGLTPNVTNQLRTGIAQINNQIRIERSRLSLTERLNASQLPLIKSLEIQKLRLEQQLKQNLGLKTAQQLRLDQRTRLEQRSRLGLRTLEISSLQVRQRLRQKQQLKAKQRARTRPRFRRFRKPKLILSSEERGKLKPFQKALSKKLGYNAFFKKGKKFIKINPKPVTEARAKDAFALVLDKSLAATGIIKRAKRPAQKLKGVPRNYFKINQRKFREFKISKGEKIATPNKFIEKRKFRLDSKQEKQKIKAARIVAKIRKANKPKKNSATSRIFRRV